MFKAPLASYPATRLRRLRQAPWIRDLVRETALTPSDLVWALVVHGGEGEVDVASMPGAPRLSVAGAAQAARTARSLGVPCIAVFPHVDGGAKDARGSGAQDPDGLVPRAVRAMKAAAPEVGVLCDVALDPYTDHGHDGVVEAGRIHNDATVELLVAQALVQARAGADILAPSDMMDGRVGALRRALEAEGHADAMIMAYAAKYASAFYGPYRDAIGSARLTAGPGDKRTYQMDPGNTEEALREVALDIARRVVEAFAVPTFAFQVSGEYAMITAAADRGWIDGELAVLESLRAFKRAGCAGVLTYFAPRAARALGA